ncbi:aspartyl-phosphate phosphatase Spo0E family protein [Bacillus sp. V59.32b]|uniref:aspartyl-phosphate phosphatase Spo0E family protein n=1 Tax=Bacillus sp. V59.32b TaxID=1758642 RepID=UPI000E3E8C87|nr:aspartyl-phosphate phosphatase Spo0E family protein [Bacillus sp. V59.32b]RFU61461.1 aspartyl-phosphate phosphatase Spo0E family protein [Bacillus sp. V59.32b]
MTAEQLLRNIEECRERMINLASYSSSMIDHKVIEASTELDMLINQYLHLSEKRKRPFVRTVD